MLSFIMMKCTLIWKVFLRWQTERSIMCWLPENSWNRFRSLSALHPAADDARKITKLPDQSVYSAVGVVWCAVIAFRRYVWCSIQFAHVCGTHGRSKWGFRIARFVSLSDRPDYLHCNNMLFCWFEQHTQAHMLVHTYVTRGVAEYTNGLWSRLHFSHTWAHFTYASTFVNVHPDAALDTPASDHVSRTLSRMTTMYTVWYSLSGQ